MSEQRIKKYRYYSIVDYEKEQEFLTKQHQEGYRFVQYIPPLVYYFEPCVPENVIYQLDYSDVEAKDKKDYLQLFNDCGWEYIMDACGWSYFRKPAGESKENEEIFSDVDSKIALIERVFKRRMGPTFIFFFLVIIPQTLHSIQRIINGYELTLIQAFFGGMFGAFCLLYAMLMYAFWKKLKVLKERNRYGR